MARSGDSGVIIDANLAEPSAAQAAVDQPLPVFGSIDALRSDGVPVNSVLPGPVLTGRRQSYLEHRVPLHNMTVEEAMVRFPQDAGHIAL